MPALSSTRCFACFQRVPLTGFDDPDERIEHHRTTGRCPVARRERDARRAARRAERRAARAAA
jgi:hypothetical protein